MATSTAGMSQMTVGVYIPFLASVSRRGPCGGYGRLKRYVAKVFARPDSNGAMTLGTVKKVEIVVTKAVSDGSSMSADDEKGFVASAFVKFVPSGTKACAKLMDEIDSDDGLRLVHNASRLLFWNIHRQKKQAKQSPEVVCPLCGNVCKEELCGTSRHRDIDDVLDALSELTCDDGPGKKRTRTRL